MVDASTGESAPAPLDAEALYSEQAQAAGIVLPRRSRFDPWTAVAIVVTVVLVTAGVGAVTGWINFRSSSPGWSYQTQVCSGSAVHTDGIVASALGPSFSAWVRGVASAMAATVGQCFSLNVNSTSGDGYLALSNGPTAEFAASYVAPTLAETRTLAFPVQTVPVALGAVALVYDLPGVPSGLNLTGPILAGIFNGTITSWDAPAIVSINPGVPLAGLPSIVPVHRTDPAAATNLLTDYLAATDPSWNASVGSGTTVAWPVGIGEDSDTAMLTELQDTPGSIGYTEIFGAPPGGLGTAAVEDAAGSFTLPNAFDTWVAANASSSSPAVLGGDWTNFSLVRTTVTFGYPLTTVAYASFYRDVGVAYSGALSLENATWLLGFVYWLTAEPSVAPLPSAFETEAVNVLNNETYDGATILHLENEANETTESGGETDEF